MKTAKPESMGFDSEKLNSIDRMLRSFTDRRQIAGISALVTRKDHVVYSGNFGYANLEKKIKVSDDTIFRIYSMSKPVTAAAAMILYERGLFLLGDPVSKYIPSFAGAGVLTGFDGDEPITRESRSDITIGHLLTMTSGLSYGFKEDRLDQYYKRKFDAFEAERKHYNLEEFTDLLARMPLAFDPGSGYRYSFSIDVLGRIIEILSGQTLSRFLYDEIFRPLKMNDTGFYVPSAKRDRLAELYVWNGEKLTADKKCEYGTFTRKPSFEMGGGGLVSTAGDYSRFCQMLLHKGELDDVRILGRKTIDLMAGNHLEGATLTHFRKNEKRGYGYGLGVRVMMDPSEAGLNGSVGEWGWDGMASTWMCVDPAEELTAVFMTQLIPYGVFPASSLFQQMMYSALLN